MDHRLTRLIILALVIVFGVYVAQPYFYRFFYSATTPRAVEPRGNLSELERSTVESRSSTYLPRWYRWWAAPLHSRLRRLPRAKAWRRKPARVSYGTRPATSSPTITWLKGPTTSWCALHPARCCTRTSSALRPTMISP